MVDNRGNAIPYTGATTGRPLPIHDPTAPPRAPREHTHKPTGLDWDAHTPACKTCTQRSGRIDDTGLCPTCRGLTPPRGKAGKPAAYTVVLDEQQLTEKFTAPTTTPPTLDDHLAELERTDPKVAAAAASYEAMVDHITSPIRVDAAALQVEPTDPSPAPGTTGPAEQPATAPAASAGEDSNPVTNRATPVRAKVRQTSPNDLVITLRGTYITHRTTEVAALLHDLLTALNRGTPQTPAAAASPAQKPANRQPATTGTNPAPRPRKGKPSRGAGTTSKPRHSKIRPHHQAVVDAYLAGDTPATIGARIGVTGRGIQNYLSKNGVPLRTRSEAIRLARTTNTTTSTGDQPA